MTTLIGTVVSTGSGAIANGFTGTRLVCRDFVAGVTGSLETVSYLDNESDDDIVFLVYSAAGALLGSAPPVSSAAGAVTGTLSVPVAVTSGTTYKLCAYCLSGYFRFLSNGATPAKVYDGGSYSAPSANITTVDEFGIQQMQLWGSGTVGPSYSLDTLSSPVSVGGTGYSGTTTGMGAVISVVNAAISSASVGSFAFSMNPFVDGAAYRAMGAQTFTVLDAAAHSASRTATLQPMTGYSYVPVAEPINTGEFALGKDPAFVAATQVHWPTAAGTINPDTTLSDFVFGIYECWRRDTDGTMRAFTLTVTLAGGVIIGPPTKLQSTSLLNGSLKSISLRTS